MSREVAVVTGAASGVGAASARRLARRGASVVVVDVDDAGGTQVADEIGGRFVHLDVGDPRAWDDLADELRRTGDLAFAHLNAGILTANDEVPLLDTPVERSLALLRVNLDGVILGVRALAPVMIERGGGAIAATASQAGLIPYGGDPVYSATKHGVVGFVRSAAPQLRRAGVRLTAVCPSGIDTPMVAGTRKARMDEAGAGFLSPDDVAAAVEALLVDGDGGTVQHVQAGKAPQTVHVQRLD
jgi:NAD(P)-dependent dehydrogenase (short-subunit alcohol dehydrogenase family)